MKGVPVIMVETWISGPNIIFQSDGEGKNIVVVERQQTCSEIYWSLLDFTGIYWSSALSGVLLI